MTLLEEVQDDYKNPKKPKKDKKIKLKKKELSLGTKLARTFIVVFFCFTGVAYIGESYADWRAEHEWQFPLEWIGFVRDKKEETKAQKENKKENTVKAESKEEVKEIKAKKTWTGEASYYSFDGCIGCNANRIMANGEVLDDMKKTLAFNELPMNTEVKVTNLSNGQSTMATVTDTGGFDKYNRIADLSVATKNIIGCNDLCQIKVEVY